MNPVIYKPRSGARIYKLKQHIQRLRLVKLVKRPDPMSPICEVSTNRLGVKTSHGNLRVMFWWPWLLGLSLTLYWNVDEFHSSWKSYERSALRRIESNIEQYGDDHYEYLAQKYPDPSYAEWGSENYRLDDELEKSRLQAFNRFENGVIPLKTYMHYHYYVVPHGAKNLRIDIGLAIFYLISIPALLYTIIRTKRRAPLYLDRERRIFYTWRDGKVWAQVYDELIYGANQTLDFILYTLDDENQVELKPYIITPSGHPFYNSPAVIEKLMATLEQFMEYGIERIATREWQGRRGWHVYNDDKPEDFDEQLENILNAIEKENVNERATQQMEEWDGFEPVGKNLNANYETAESINSGAERIPN